MDHYSARSRVGGLPTPPNDMYNGYRGYHGHPSRKSAAYEQSTYQVPPAPIMYHAPMQYNNNPAMNAPGLPRMNHFGHVGQPTLPPIGDVASHSYIPPADRQQQQDRRQTAVATKSDKVVGGVSQELDYELDQMTDYVAEMAQEMYAIPRNICLSDIDITRSIMPRTKVSSHFRKFVAGILTSTRLPSSTILLGLNYLSKRVALIHATTSASYNLSESQLWRMLTIALLLGSKFLDDNTFQNRSWSEVSNIPVTELNIMEQEWLLAISWNLHVNFDKDSDYQCWIASWASWKYEENRCRAMKLDRLAPLDTTVRRSQYYQRKDLSPLSHNTYSRDRTPPSFQLHSRYDVPQQAYWDPCTSDDSVSSAPETGPNTPEWMMQLPNAGMPPAGWHNNPISASAYADLYNARQHYRATQRASHIPHQASLMPYTHYPQQSSYWHSHPSNCACSQCYSTEPYFHAMSHRGYGQQTVVG